MSGGAQTTGRLGLIASGLLAAALLLLPSPAAAAPDRPEAGAQAGPDATPAAGISIIHGGAARIADWPWQVAIASRKMRRGKRGGPVDRVYCGGAVIAPRLVITAGHCVNFLKRPRADSIEVISGRTWLGREDAGRVSRVSRVIMPLSPSGRPRFRESGGSASWDVSLLLLKRPVTATPIRLAGPDEVASWAPGQPVWTTGWGVTSNRDRRASPGLRVARQIMFPGSACRFGNGRNFNPGLMNCLGGSSGHSTSCFGDSGGPLVALTGDGYRLVGLTSFGDGLCSPRVPSVDTRVAGKPIRNWVVSTALGLTGDHVLGSGGETAPAPEWCRVPRVFELTPAQARRKLRRHRCALGLVLRDPYGFGPRGTIVSASRPPGWLAPVGFPLKVWVPR